VATPYVDSPLDQRTATFRNPKMIIVLGDSRYYFLNIYIFLYMLQYVFDFMLYMLQYVFEYTTCIHVYM